MPASRWGHHGYNNPIDNGDGRAVQKVTGPARGTGLEWSQQREQRRREGNETVDFDTLMQAAVQQAATIFTGVALTAAVGTALLGTTVLFMRQMGVVHSGKGPLGALRPQCVPGFLVGALLGAVLGLLIAGGVWPEVGGGDAAGTVAPALFGQMRVLAVVVASLGGGVFGVVKTAARQGEAPVGVQ